MEDTKGAIWSKINFTQVVAFLAMVATIFGFDINPELQVQIVAAITAITTVVTIVFRSYFTNKKIEGVV